jgi:glycosyltransferase involved in cell wall biosynthesis
MFQESTSKARKLSIKKLNICILPATPFDPNMPARPAITEIYGEYIPSFGHKVTWITPCNESRKKVQEEFFKEVRLYKISYPLHASLIVKIFTKIPYLFREYKLITNNLTEERYDIIQVRNSVFEALLALHIKRKYHIPFVFQYSFPKEVYKEYKSTKQRFYLGKIENCITKHILHKADLIFPISKWMEKELIKEGIPKSRMMSLPLGVNTVLFSPAKNGMKVREKYDLNSAKVILYVGTMDKLRELDIIIHAFSKVRTKKKNATLLMVGDGDGRTNLEALALRCGINEDSIFTGQVSYFDVPYFIASADVCVCPVPPLSIYKISSPTKLFEYMVMGKAVVANEEIPEQKEVIEESGGGVLVKFDDESFADGIIELLNNPTEAEAMGRKGHEWVVKNRSYENMARDVEKRYYELLEQKR